MRGAQLHQQIAPALLVAAYARLFADLVALGLHEGAEARRLRQPRARLRPQPVVRVLEQIGRQFIRPHMC
jgi:hypothetical protein